MQKLPDHSTFLQDVHDFLQALSKEKLPELLPDTVMYGIYLRQKGLPPDIASDANHRLFLQEMIFAQCVKFVLENGDPNLLPYVYTSSHASATNSGHSRITGLEALCRKYKIDGWGDNGAPNWYYSGIRYQKQKGGHALCRIYPAKILKSASRSDVTSPCTPDTCT